MSNTHLSLGPDETGTGNISVKAGPYTVNLEIAEVSGTYETNKIEVSKNRPAILSSSRFIDKSKIPLSFDTKRVSRIEEEVKSSSIKL